MKDERGWTCSTYGGEEIYIYICRVLVSKPKGYSPLGGCRHRCEDNNRINIRDTG